MGISRRDLLGVRVDADVLSFVVDARDDQRRAGNGLNPVDDGPRSDGTGDGELEGTVPTEQNGVRLRRWYKEGGGCKGRKERFVNNYWELQV